VQVKRNLVNFTRGSQLLGHFGFMFAAGLKGPLLIALVVTSWTIWWWLSSGLSDHETYLAWMRVYAAGYTFMEFDPHKLVRLETGFGGTLELPMSMVDKFPPVTRAWQHMLTLLCSAFAYAGAALVPAFIGFSGSLRGSGSARKSASTSAARCSLRCLSWSKRSARTTTRRGCANCHRPWDGAGGC
jgi:hypothetical protein